MTTPPNTTDETKREKLRECPFCGGEAKVNSLPKNGTVNVECTKCYIKGEMFDIAYRGAEAKAVKAWKTRPVDASVGVEALAEPLFNKDITSRENLEVTDAQIVALFKDPKFNKYIFEHGIRTFVAKIFDLARQALTARTPVAAVDVAKATALVQAIDSWGVSQQGNPLLSLLYECQHILKQALKGSE